MELYHSKVSIQDAEGINESINPFAATTLLSYRKHLEFSWPEIKNDIEIGFIRGTNGSEICFSHSLGWENKDWISFVQNGIALPIAIENCKKQGIKKFVFCCNNEIMEITPDEF